MSRNLKNKEQRRKRTSDFPFWDLTKREKLKQRTVVFCQRLDMSQCLLSHARTLFTQKSYLKHKSLFLHIKRDLSEGSVFEDDSSIDICGSRLFRSVQILDRRRQKKRIQFFFSKQSGFFDHLFFTKNFT